MRCVYDDKLNISFVIIFHENVCCGCTLELPHRSDSNEQLQHRFSWINEVVPQ